MAGQVIGFDLVMNDRDDIGTQEYVAWANLNGGGLNDPDGWGDLVLGEELSGPAVNQPPVADLSLACVDLNCRFADLSTDADGTVVSWSWNFGDGNGSSAQSPRHSYAAGGIYIVSLTVTDDDGASASDQVTVTVEGSTAVEVSFVSIASEDGWVREAGENSNVGGRVKTGGTGSKALRAGDDGNDRQYKFFVSFDTSSIPDTATIQSATLQLTRGGTSGTNPFTTHGLLHVDINKGSFGSGAGLQSSDFEAAASGTQLATISNQGGLGAVYTVDISLGGAVAHINDAGRTQFRMYFALDDDDDRATDYAGFYSTDNRTSARHPRLIVTYVE